MIHNFNICLLLPLSASTRPTTTAWGPFCSSYPHSSCNLRKKRKPTNDLSCPINSQYEIWIFESRRNDWLVNVKTMMMECHSLKLWKQFSVLLMKFRAERLHFGQLVSWIQKWSINQWIIKFENLELVTSQNEQQRIKNRRTFTHYAWTHETHRRVKVSQSKQCD